MVDYAIHMAKVNFYRKEIYKNAKFRRETCHPCSHDEFGFSCAIDLYLRNLAQQWMVSVATATVAAYLQHIHGIENTFKKSDSFAEQIEEEIVDEDEEVDSEDDDGFDQSCAL